MTITVWHYNIITQSQLAECPSHLPDVHVWAVCNSIWKRVYFSICRGYVSPISVWWETAYRKQRWTFISHRTRGGIRAAIVATPQKEDCFPTSAFCVHIPITHLANRKESQTHLDLWPKIAPIPLCSDKWHTRKSGSLWTIERGKTRSTGND